MFFFFFFFFEFFGLCLFVAFVSPGCADLFFLPLSLSPSLSPSLSLSPLLSLYSHITAFANSHQNLPFSLFTYFLRSNRTEPIMSFSRDNDANARRGDYKKGMDGDDARRSRAKTTVELRKAKREQQIRKRRLLADGMLARFNQNKAYNDPKMVERLQALPRLANQLRAQDPQQQFEATAAIRKMLSVERQPPIDEVIAQGVVPRLCEFLKFSSHQPLQFEAAWALTNIASGTTDHTRIVIEHGGIDLFVNLLRSPHADVREQAVWALGNIAGDSCYCRDLVLFAGAMQPLLACCNPTQPSVKQTMIRNATWTLSNLCRGKPQPPFELVKPAVNALASLIFLKDEEVLTDACWALSYLSDDTGPDNSKIQAVVQSGACARLIELLYSRNASIIVPALRTIGNVVTGDDLQTQTVINNGGLDALVSLITNSRKGIRKEACWTISNITAGSPRQIQAVIDKNLLRPLVMLLKSDEFDVKKEAAWAISNAAAGGTDEHLFKLVEEGAVSPLVALLQEEDARVVMVALEGLENILRVGEKYATKNGGVNAHRENIEQCGGVRVLEDLEDHDNDEIYDKVCKILREYFDAVEEEDEDTATAPQAQGQQFGFGVQAQGNDSTMNF
jgi:importin subunit alpha-6/7